MGAGAVDENGGRGEGKAQAGPLDEVPEVRTRSEGDRSARRQSRSVRELRRDLPRCRRDRAARQARRPRAGGPGLLDLQVMLFLAGAELGGVDGRALDDLLGRRELIVAFGEGDLRGLAAAAMLFADYSVLRGGASVVIDTPAGWAGLAWRLGAGAYRWYLRGGWVSVIGCRLSVLSREPRSSVRRSTDDRQPTTDNP